VEAGAARAFQGGQEHAPHKVLSVERGLPILSGENPRALNRLGRLRSSSRAASFMGTRRASRSSSVGR